MNYILNKGIQMEELEDGIIVSVVNELKSMYEKEAPIEEDLRDFCRDLEKEGIISKNNDDSLCEN